MEISPEYAEPDRLLHFICIVVLSIILHEVITAAEASFNWAIAPTSVLPITSSKSAVPIVMLPSLNVSVTSEKIIEALLYLPEIILLVKAEFIEVIRR